MNTETKLANNHEANRTDTPEAERKFSTRLITVWEILVKEFSTSKFFQLSAMLEEMIHNTKTVQNPYEIFGQEEKVTVSTYLKMIEGYGEYIKIPVSMALIAEMIRGVLSGSLSSFGELGDELREVRRRIEHELASYLFFYIPQDRVSYYTDATKGWEPAIERWKDTVSDIEEAGKCFALGRYAAAIFHSLQVVEFGLIELGEFIHIHDPKSGWTAVTAELSNIVKKKYADRSDFEKQHFAFLEQVQGTVEALKNAWRNKISHAQGRLILLSADFGDEIAEEILLASRAFMRRLATEMPE